MRDCCERCEGSLPPDSADARICSFECTFCAGCADGELAGRCPNCGGELLTRQKRSIANLPAKTRTALGMQGAAVASRKRTGRSSPKTRQELYDEARRRGLPGRSKMGRDELARTLGHQ